MLKGVTDPLQHGAFEPGWQSAPPGYPPPYPQYPGPGSYFDPFAPYGRHPVTGQPFSDKSKTVAGLLQLLGLFGIAGIGRIYLGHTGLGIAQLAAAGLPVDVVVVGRWGDRHTQLGQLCADRLDTPPQTIGALAVALMIGDEPGN
ncbi:Conserved membrane protein of uncharacterised function [Mycobacterium tuberculosis]|nr:Conserved membrane protein of uncharacterised function [Mycobacterium tuberculosis]